MLSYTQYKPSNSLANYIECYWICKVPGSTMSPLERLIPGGRIEMIINFGNPMLFLVPDNLSGGEAVTHAHIMGQRSHIYYARQNGDTNLLGIRFKPGGIGAFTKLPAADLLNQLVPAEDVLGAALKDWKDQLREKKNDGERIYLLDQLIIKILKGTTAEWATCTKAVDTIRKNSPVFVNDVCNENGTYYKKIERSFLKYVGYTPKHYHRIIRFNRALRLLHESSKSLTSICYDCDYYDQSHFIKDFRQFAGTTPKRFQLQDNAMASFLINHQNV